jgi:anti-sigma regulatory factor (Ser/Thr protein kinase)
MTPPDKPVDHLEFALAADPEAPRTARRALNRLDGVLPASQMESLRLLVSELVTNSVSHAMLAPGASILVAVTVSTALVRVEVRDPGIGFEPNPVRPPVNQPSGWGLYLVERVADRWGVIQGRPNQVWFELDRTG